MPKSSLEKLIAEASGNFALEIVNAIKGATLEDLLSLQAADTPKKPGPKPGKKRAKPGPKPGKKRAKPGPKPGKKRAKPGPKPGKKRVKPGPKPKKK